VKIESDLPPTQKPATTTETPRVEAESSSREAAVDIELLRKSAAGDGKAFHALVDRHADRLYRVAVSLVGNSADAEDVLQEAFTGAYRGLSGFQGRASVKTWLTRILVMQAAKWRRDRKRRRSGAAIDDEADVQPAAPGDSGRAGVVDARIDVHAAVQRLSVEHREVIALREFEHLSYDEMAEVLELPRGTVESRLHRARAELKEILKSYLP
jgi:RNA polymerase sigma-70 factor (ECF subfamily)